ncbi:glycolate oxidase subunit GlcF [Phytohalomonas tamaricis]|uniref:glycolate oxidase subunit GlcF n=1 Tax=Phytohalomonas tamaricis TaxID=2081032 RepID=UPI000D0AD015|nr:glycolate oxidase subunit GlcF [Phytohalomonas tamaricis]
MQTTLSERARALPRGNEADTILRKCVHCGFCNATCPTYQLLGDERDGPRGRIYLMKELLEGHDVTRSTQVHLDRCLTCRNCETTCPSGVTYHALLDIARPELERQVGRTPRERALRRGLRFMLADSERFNLLLKAGQTLRAVLPGTLRARIPPRAVAMGQRPDPRRHTRQMLILNGCVQPGLSPNTNAAAMRVLDRFGIGVTAVPEAGCCGAIDYHLDAQQVGRQRMRRNIDAWWPSIEDGAEAIIQTASGCGAFIKEYGEMLKDDPDYAAKARRVSALAKDLVEILKDENLERVAVDERYVGQRRLAFHCPCTLQHAQKLGGAVENVLTRFGFSLAPVRDAHLCCGSAGTYSITQPELSRRLRDDKLAALEEGAPEAIVTANIGCQMHLGGASKRPVSHWLELVDRAINAAPDAYTKESVVNHRGSHKDNDNDNQGEHPCGPRLY